MTAIPPFSQELAVFEPYFSSVAQISGALLGLVFVSLTFNPKTLGMRHDIGMRSLAQQVFADFLMVMVVALILLIPGDTTGYVGLVLAVIALIGLTRITRSALALIRDKHALRMRLLQRFWLSLLGNIGFLAAGILLYQGIRSSGMWAALVGSPILLLVGGARSAWLLVMQNAE